MMVTLQRICHRRGHLLLLGAVFEVLSAGQDASFPKHFMNVSGKPLVEIVAKRDHRCPLLEAVLPVFPLKTGSALPWRALRSGASVSDGVEVFVVSKDLHDGRTIRGPTRQD
jgi:hypothetical protein